MLRLLIVSACPLVGEGDEEGEQASEEEDENEGQGKVEQVPCDKGRASTESSGRDGVDLGRRERRGVYAESEAGGCGILQIMQLKWLR